MRKEFAQAIIDNYSEKQVFLTGDLGFMALEQVREVYGNRFINAGVAEQNMVSLAAGMAKEGFIPWVYSISPFVTLRPYEQIRNDVCQHHLPVKLVGNGGGYGYGIMGASHHNLEDIGTMRILPDMKVYVPYNAEDVFACVKEMITDINPNYLRLNLAAKLPNEVAAFAPWRRLNEVVGAPPTTASESPIKAIIIGTGPVTENVYTCGANKEDFEVWLVSKFPIEPPPIELIQAIQHTKNVITIEEHNGQGGLNETLAAMLLSTLNVPITFNSLFANGYPSGRFGDQKFHQAENCLEGINLKNKLNQFTLS